jgi:hypothetical protein
MQMILPLATTTALILAVFFVLGLPLSIIASTRFRPALAVPIGLLLVPILVFVVWQGAAPEWRSTLFMGTGVVCGFGGLAVLIRRRHWVGAGVTTAALLLIVLHRIWPAYQLSKTAGFSAGNGDLPYLARRDRCAALRSALQHTRGLAGSAQTVEEVTWLKPPVKPEQRYPWREGEAVARRDHSAELKAPILCPERKASNLIAVGGSIALQKCR